MSDVRLGVIGAAPLAAGALLPATAVAGAGAWCPFRAATGLPCPFCGATRAFVAFGHGDGSFWSYGAVWVLVALALVALAVLPRRVTPGRWTWPAVAGVTVVAWAWALAHAGTISP